jgi:CubicO group peptidase (beta-lactamase class C family)
MAFRFGLLLALALALLGACHGKTIIPIPTGINWSPLDQLLSQAVSDGVFPGCVALVGSPKGVLYAKPFGSFTYGIPPPYNPGRNPNVTLDTLYDMASCSKVVGATSAIAQFYQRGELNLGMLFALPG